MWWRGLLLLGSVATATATASHTILKPLSDMWWIYIGICVGLTVIAGLMSGLTLGLLGMDLLYLEVLSKGGEEDSQKYAKRIMGLVKRRHWVLVTLLLSNSAAMEALPLFLDRMVHPALAVVISVTVVLMFGEIIPQAVCSKWGLAIGYHTTWFVWLLMILFAPIAWPISKVLDLVLGEHGATFYRRSELKELVIAHARSEASGHRDVPDHDERLSHTQAAAISGAIDAQVKTLGDCYRPLNEVYSLDVRTLLTTEILHQMVHKGHSRIPIWNGHKENLIGILRVKMLIVQDNLAGRYIRELPLSPLPRYPPQRPLYDVLQDFQAGKSHMVCVEDPETSNALGIATLEDVIEEILLQEIDQEKDAAYTLPPMWITSRGSVFIPKSPVNPSKTPILRKAQSQYVPSGRGKMSVGALGRTSDAIGPLLSAEPQAQTAHSLSPPQPSLLSSPPPPVPARPPMRLSVSQRQLWRSTSSVVIKDPKSFAKTAEEAERGADAKERMSETSRLLPTTNRSIN